MAKDHVDIQGNVERRVCAATAGRAHLVPALPGQPVLDQPDHVFGRGSAPELPAPHLVQVTARLVDAAAHLQISSHASVYTSTRKLSIRSQSALGGSGLWPPE